MNRAGAILIPLLAGFLFTLVVVSWRSGWWPRGGIGHSAAVTPIAAAPIVETRPPHLQVEQAHVIAASPAAVHEPTGPASAAPAAQSEPVSASLEPTPVPRVDPGNSRELLEAPARKFARGADSGGD